MSFEIYNNCDKYNFKFEDEKNLKENAKKLPKLKSRKVEWKEPKRREDDKEEKGKYVHKERYYGHCSRSFYVGEQIKEDDVSAEFKNGILKICIPKKEEGKELPEAKHIKIN